jgi:hypothetical protein
MTNSINPIEMLREIEAYFCFRSGPIPESEWRAMKYDIAHLLHRNGLKGYEYARKAREIPVESNVSTNVSTGGLVTQA